MKHTASSPLRHPQRNREQRRINTPQWNAMLGGQQLPVKAPGHIEVGRLGPPGRLIVEGSLEVIFELGMKGSIGIL